MCIYCRVTCTYTCADDVLCCVVLNLKCILKEEEIKEESCHHSRQALTAKE